MINQAILIPYLTILFSDQSAFAQVDIGGPKFLFILLGRVFLLCKTMILGGLGGVREYWLLNVRFFVIHKVKQTKNCSFYKNEKIANFQTKVDFNDLRWINGSL